MNTLLIIKSLRNIYSKLKYLRLIKADAGVFSNSRLLNKNENKFSLPIHYLGKRCYSKISHLQTKQETLEHHFSNSTHILKNYVHICSEKLKKNYKLNTSFEQCGPDHQPKFICTLRLNGFSLKEFKGFGKSKKSALSEASQKILSDLYSEKRIDQCGLPLDQKTKILPPILKSLRKEIPLSIEENVLSRMEELKHQFDTVVSPLLLKSEESQSPDNEETDAQVSYFDFMTGDFFSVFPGPDSARNEELLLHTGRMKGKEPRYSYRISNWRDEVLNTIKDNRVIIIEGGTGCGKSTQVPQMILDNWIKEGKGSECNVVVTQPRRLPTISVASWIAYEREEQLGETVGYKMRLDEQFVEQRGGIMFYTCGSLRELMKMNPSLEGISHVIIDEVHERSIDIDLILLKSKLILEQAKENSSTTFKLVLMSATAKVDALKDYFGTNAVVRVDSSNTYPVATYYADQIRKAIRLSEEDCDHHSNGAEIVKRKRMPAIDIKFVVDIIRFIHKTKSEGAVLVFLTGWKDIMDIENALASDTDLWVLPLHSKLSRKNQQRIFQRSLDGRRKVVLATNIAETSITVDDAVYVVDSGLQNDIGFNAEKNLSSFGTTWITKANAEQRKGRAGRVQPGEVFRLYDKETFDHFKDFPETEMKKRPLDWVVLHCKSLFEESNVRDLLEQVIDPPSSLAIEAAIVSLTNLGMLHYQGTDNANTECLTSLGRAVCKLSTRPSLAKAMILGLFLGYHPLTLNFVALESKQENMFISELSAGQFRRLKLMSDNRSDILAMCIFLGKFERALTRCTLLEKDELDLQLEECERLVSMKGVKVILDEADEEIVEHLNHVVWEYFEELIQIKNLLKKQMMTALPRLHSKSFRQHSFNEFLAIREMEGDEAHSDLVLSCILSSVDLIISNENMSLRIVENGKKVSMSSSSVLSRGFFSDDVLFFALDMYFWKIRNSFVTGNLSEVPFICVALFYGQGLEQIPADRNETDVDNCSLRIKGREVIFLTDKRTANCLLDLRQMFQSIFNYYIEPHSANCHKATIEDFTVKLKEIIKDIVERRDYVDSSDDIWPNDTTVQK